MYEVTHSSDTHHDLKILNVQPENTGLYTCKLPDATEAKEGPAYLIGLGKLHAYVNILTFKKIVCLSADKLSTFASKCTAMTVLEQISDHERTNNHP